jgi:hypothetical protein
MTSSAEKWTHMVEGFSLDSIDTQKDQTLSPELLLLETKIQIICGYDITVRKWKSNTIISFAMMMVSLGYIDHIQLLVGNMQGFR